MFSAHNQFTGGRQRLQIRNEIGCYSLFDLLLMCFFKIGTLLVTGGCYSDTLDNMVLEAKIKMLLVIYLL